MEAMVPQKFHKWLKVFGKVESERMPTRKIWDHAIDLKEEFKASKARVYPLSRNEREEVQQFIQDHLRKGYIRPSKSPQCHKPPPGTQNSTVRGMGRTRAILGWARRGFLNKREITGLGHMTSHMTESSGRIGSYLSVHIDK